MTKNRQANCMQGPRVTTSFSPKLLLLNVVFKDKEVKKPVACNQNVVRYHKWQ